MNVGLPGTGVGGVYYMLLVLFMPVRAARHVLRCERPVRWAVVARQTALVAAIVAALWAESWLVGVAAETCTPGGALAVRRVLPWIEEDASMARLAGLASAATLATVMLALALARIFARRPAPRPPCRARQ